MTTSRAQAPPVNLKERIAALEQRNAALGGGPASRATSPPPGSAPAPTAASALRDKIAKFEKKGGVPVPRGSFGLGAPPVADAGQSRKRGELYGNRIASAPGATLRPHALSVSRSPSPSIPSSPHTRARTDGDDDAAPSDLALGGGEPALPPSPPPAAPMLTPMHTGDFAKLGPAARTAFNAALDAARRTASASESIGNYGTRKASVTSPASPPHADVPADQDAGRLDVEEAAAVPPEIVVSPETILSPAPVLSPDPILSPEAPPSPLSPALSNKSATSSEHDANSMVPSSPLSPGDVGSVYSNDASSAPPSPAPIDEQVVSPKDDEEQVSPISAPPSAALSPPAFISPALSSPALSSPALSSAALPSPALSSPALSSPAPSSRGASSPALSSPALSSPAFSPVSEKIAVTEPSTPASIASLISPHTSHTPKTPDMELTSPAASEYSTHDEPVPGITVTPSPSSDAPTSGPVSAGADIAAQLTLPLGTPHTLPYHDYAHGSPDADAEHIGALLLEAYDGPSPQSEYWAIGSPGYLAAQRSPGTPGTVASPGTPATPASLSGTDAPGSAGSYESFGSAGQWEFVSTLPPHPPLPGVAATSTITVPAERPARQVALTVAIPAPTLDDSESTPTARTSGSGSASSGAQEVTVSRRLSAGGEASPSKVAVAQRVSPVVGRGVPVFIAAADRSPTVDVKGPETTSGRPESRIPVSKIPVSRPQGEASPAKAEAKPVVKSEVKPAPVKAEIKAPTIKPEAVPAVADDEEPAANPRARPMSTISQNRRSVYSTIVYSKVTETPPVPPMPAVPVPVPTRRDPPRATAIPRPRQTIIVETPETSGFSDLSALLEEAALLEARLLEGDAPSPLPAARPEPQVAPPSPVKPEPVPVTTPAPAPEENDTLKPRQSLKNPLIRSKSSHRRETTIVAQPPRSQKEHIQAKASISSLRALAPPAQPVLTSSPSLPLLQASLGPSPTPSPGPSPTPSAASLPPQGKPALTIQEPSDIGVPPTPPPKSPPMKYLSGFRRMASTSRTMPGGYPRQSLSTSSEISSEDSFALVTPPEDAEFGANRQSQSQSVRWPSGSPKKAPSIKSIGRASSFAERIWHRARTKSGASVSSTVSHDYSEAGEHAPSLNAVPERQIVPPARGSSLYPAADARPVSWASTMTTDTAGMPSPFFDRDLFDAFPSVPEQTPAPQQAQGSGRPAPSLTLNSSFGAPLLDDSQQHQLHPESYAALGRAATMPLRMRKQT